MPAPETHVRIQTKHGLLWTRAWTTGTPGLVVVHDEERNRWTLTHRASGKAVIAVRAHVLEALRAAAYHLKDHDWTVDEEAIGEGHHEATNREIQKLTEWFTTGPHAQVEPPEAVGVSTV